MAAFGANSLRDFSLTKHLQKQKSLNLRRNKTGIRRKKTRVAQKATSGRMPVKQIAKTQELAKTTTKSRMANKRPNMIEAQRVETTRAAGVSKNKRMI